MEKGNVQQVSGRDIEEHHEYRHGWEHQTIGDQPALNVVETLGDQPPPINRSIRRMPTYTGHLSGSTGCGQCHANEYLFSWWTYPASATSMRSPLIASNR